MAEFCLECWNKLMETNDPAEKYVLSKELDFCEECAQWKPVIVRIRRGYGAVQWLRDVTRRLRRPR